MLKSTVSGDQSDFVRVMTNICSSMKKCITARTSGVLRDVDIVTAMRNQILALTIVHTDYALSTKQMLSSKADIGQSDHVHVMTNTSSLMKKRITARISGVLKVVENATALTEQTDALIIVPMDYSSITRMMLNSMALSEQ